MTCSSLAARGQTIMKIRPDFRYTGTLRNYKGDEMFSSKRRFMLIEWIKNGTQRSGQEICGHIFRRKGSL